MNRRRALTLVAVAAASLASLATSPQRWSVAIPPAAPVRVTLDAAHPTVERTLIVTFSRDARFATPASAQFALYATLTATVSGATGEAPWVRARVVPASLVASGAPSPAAVERPLPFTETVVASADWSAPYTVTTTERVTVVFERTHNNAAGTVEVTATLSGRIHALGELPPGARVTIAESQ